MPRLLHTADWQIGRAYTRWPPESAVPLAEARLAVVERLAALATAQQVDAVLVAGDVFDVQTVSERVLRQLFQALAGFAGPWVLLPGNHDAALSESVWQRARRLQLVAPNVHLALAPEPIVLAQAGIVVLPAPLLQRHTHDDLTAWFDAAETPAGLARIGLAHGCVQGVLPEDIDSPNPIAPDRAERARLDYLALGDWHGCRAIDARTGYSGTPEPDRFRSLEAGHALLIELEAGGPPPQVTRLATGRYRWQQLAPALQVASDLDALLATLAALGRDDVVELRLSGRLDLEGQLRLDAALAAAEARVRHLAVERGALQLLPTADDLAALRADGYLDALIEELRQAQQPAVAAPSSTLSPDVAREALALLAGALAERRRESESP
ncbi:MAG: hypothetical protein RL489_3243 [Pseudomonadota bacterium]|jgi:DNA repair exonuclease SbcCD nuclease subunit